MSESALEAADRVDLKMTAPGRIGDLADELAGLSVVDHVAHDDERDPQRLSVVVTRADMPASVLDRIDEYSARVVPESVHVTADGTLAFDLTTPELFRPAGKRAIREYGASTAITFTQNSLDESEFEQEEEVRIFARNGAVLLVRDEMTADDTE